ncbi:hypothetical protein Fmac_021255 [Flemingia macrophylla]|uniref:Uncharacterized protein n=1 Tax=Flemingia macrophylla TaxID=520843 RepID=A0ABD1LWU8_9FABA
MTTAKRNIPRIRHAITDTLIVQVVGRSKNTPNSFLDTVISMEEFGNDHSYYGPSELVNCSSNACVKYHC